MTAFSFQKAATNFRSVVALLFKPDATDSATADDPIGTSDQSTLLAVVPGLSLSSRFAFAATIVLCNGMALLGGWVVHEVEKGLLQNTAAFEATYVQHLFEPIAQNLAKKAFDPREIEEAADGLIKGTPIGTRLMSVAIWLPDNTIVYLSLIHI